MLLRECDKGKCDKGTVNLTPFFEKVSSLPSPCHTLIAIVGATGTGKSALADALAAQLRGELISADSMQVYRGMDIGTAKTPPEHRSVTYHGIDLVEPDFPFTAALYQRHARAVIDRLLAAGVTPVICGGTGLYVRVALDNFFFDEGRDGQGKSCQGDGKLDNFSRKVVKFTVPLTTSKAENLRARLTAQAEELGAEAFHELLAQADPQSAALIHPNNVRRVVRAFELLEQETSYAKQHEGFNDFKAVYPVRFIGIAVEPAVLYQTIECRVDGMLAAGLLEEVRGLVEAGFREALTAQQAIGYKELVPVLEGTTSLEDAIAAIKQSTRRYAKRQRTWFNRDKRIEWIDATDLHRAVLGGELTEKQFTQSLLDRANALLRYPSL